MPINDDEDDEAEEEHENPQQNYAEQKEYQDDDGDAYKPSEDEMSPPPDEESFLHESIVSKAHLGEVEASLEATDSYLPSSPSADPMSPTISEDSFSLPVQPTIAPPRSPSPVVKAAPISRSGSGYTVGEDGRPSASDGTGKSHSTWDKVRNAIMRTTSNGGLRSRANSVTRERRTSSSISRESGASQGDKTEIINAAIPMHTPMTPPMLSPSASASYLNLPPNPPRGGVSPIPPASSADLMKYDNAKLFPFPGMKKLEEERNRSKGLTSSSSPDVASPGTLSPDPSGSGSGSTLPSTPLEGPRERKLSHQASDSRLLAKYHDLNSPPLASATVSASSYREYFDLPSVKGHNQQSSTSMKLPKDRKGVKEWLKVFSQGSGSTPNQMQPSLSGTPASESAKPKKKPSLSDLLLGRKEGELSANWEDVSGDNTPTSASGSTLRKPISVKQDVSVSVVRDPYPTANGNGHPVAFSSDSSHVAPRMGVRPQESIESTDYAPWPSPPDHPSSATPDPLSSLDEYNRSTSESGSMVSSQYSTTSAHETPSQGRVVLERLDEMLGRGSRSPMWASAVDGPPRKLILSSPVLQVVDSNTVKDRFLFLFNDIIVIAKPITHDHDSLIDPTPLDRKFTVKNIVQLRNLRFTSERDMAGGWSASYARHPAMTTFVQQFARDPEQATATLFSRTNSRLDPHDVAQILFRTSTIDRARLGEYLCRRSSRPILKAYADAFGLSGLRIDKALRCFLQSLVVPTKSGNYSPLEYLSDAFAGRWYEANAARVPFNKDMAIRLCRAIIQLNQALHGGVAGSYGFTDHNRREVSGQAFVSAFKLHDRTGNASEELLDKIYQSVRRERLSQVQDPLDGKLDIAINVKRPIPSRLTYRSQSDPVVIRLPQPDPHFYIELFGEDLVFEPAVLSFAKSAEASFRITGTAFGSHVMFMVRAGPNAPLYTGLPLNSTVTVERAFMRHTFQLAFQNHHGLKRKYMFSVDDPLIRHQWTVSLKRQIDAVADVIHQDNPAPAPTRFHRAADAVAFKVLQDTLIAPFEHTIASLAVNKALSREAASNQRFPGDGRFTRTNGMGLAVSAPTNRTSHVRSKSRSKVYHRHGPGKMEMESNAIRGRHRQEVSSDLDDDLSRQPEGPTWSGQDLQMLCQQNSSIALVLSFLQVGSPDHHSFQWSPES
jgi:serine/arginine repetitive matrix protein 2